MFRECESSIASAAVLSKLSPATPSRRAKETLSNGMRSPPGSTAFNPCCPTTSNNIMSSCDQLMSADQQLTVHQLFTSKHSPTNNQLIAEKQLTTSNQLTPVNQLTAVNLLNVTNQLSPRAEAGAPKSSVYSPTFSLTKYVCIFDLKILNVNINSMSPSFFPFMTHIIESYLINDRKIYSHDGLIIIMISVFDSLPCT